MSTLDIGGLFPPQPQGLPPSGKVPPPKGTFSNITGKAKGLFGGIKERWNENNPNEKRYLIIAAAVLAIVMLIFGVLGMVFGFGSAFLMLPTLMPIAFLATWPMLMYGVSKQRSKPPTAAELALEQAKEKRAEEAAKSVRIYNKKMRAQRAARVAASTANSRSIS